MLNDFVIEIMIWNTQTVKYCIIFIFCNRH